MKVLLLADINSPHVRRWALGLSSKETEIAIFGFSAPKTNWYKEAGIHYFNPIKFEVSREDSFRKIKYLALLKNLKDTIKIFKPDILHAHYATSYGLLGNLSNFHPFLVSLWGSDIYLFPKKSFIHKNILKYNLKNADLILSTSMDMAKEASKYSSKEIEITPFGVDTDFFKPKSNKVQYEKLTIGIVKSLEYIYGIDILIQVFAILKKRYSYLQLQITGDGSQRSKLEELCIKMGLDQSVKFTGRKKAKDLVQSYQNIDIAVFPSRVESFGVAIAEASACGVPVVASNVGGIPEVVEDNVTGKLCRSESINDFVDSLDELIKDPELRQKMGEKGRLKIIEEYNQELCVRKMLQLYKSVYDKNFNQKS